MVKGLGACVRAEGRHFEHILRVLPHLLIKTDYDLTLLVSRLLPLLTFLRVVMEITPLG